MKTLIHLMLWASGVLLSCSVQAAENMRFYGTLIEPPPCVINNDRPIEVNFGDDVMTSRVDGNAYKRMPVTYTLSCTGNATNALRMQIDGDGATFNNMLLRTDKTDFAIALILDGFLLSVDKWFDFTYPVLPILEAVPSKNPAANLTGGKFSATATMKIDYR